MMIVVIGIVSIDFRCINMPNKHVNAFVTLTYVSCVN